MLFILQTAVLFLIQLGCIYYTVKYIGDNCVSVHLDIGNIIKLIWIACIMTPLLEEALFRGVGRHYLQGNPYDNYIISALFGLAHIQNYFLMHKSIKHAIIQVFCCMYLGYYIFLFDNFLYGYLIHAYHNFFVGACSYAISYYKQKNKENDVIELCTKADDFSLVPLNLDNFISNFKCPNVTRDDMIKCGGYKYINKNKMNKEMRDRTKKLENIMFKNISKNKFKCPSMNIYST